MKETPLNTLVITLTDGLTAKQKSRLRSKRKCYPNSKYLFAERSGASLPASPAVHGDTIRIPAATDLGTTPSGLKLLRFCRDHFAFNYVLLIDKYTWIYPERLLQYLESKPEYAGAFSFDPYLDRTRGLPTPPIKTPNRGPFAELKTGIVLSRSALTRALVPTTTVDPDQDFFLDKYLGDVLREEGVPFSYSKAFSSFGDQFRIQSPIAVQCAHERNFDRQKFRSILGSRWHRRLFLKRPTPIQQTTQYLPCASHRFLTVPIPKCGSTTLNALILRENGLKLQTQKSTDIQAQGAPYLVGEAPQGFLRFCIYRDPVERFVSTYLDKSKVNYPPFVQAGIRGAPMDEFIAFASENLSPMSLSPDPHLLPQLSFYDFEDVDYIVPLGSLPQFLELEFGIQNVPRYHKARRALVLTEAQRSRIEVLYACDTLIPLSPKLFVPCQEWLRAA